MLIDPGRHPADSVASGPDLLYRLTYADTTGETAIRNLLAITGDDLTVVDAQGNPVFFIRKNVLIDAVLPHLSFTLTRRGRNNIRAHKKKSPTATGDQNQNPTITKENRS